MSIINDLSAQILQGQPIANDVFNAHEYSLKAGIKGWTPFVNACINHISWSNGTNNGNKHSGEVLKYLLSLAFIDESVKDSIQKLLITGQFQNFVHHQQAKQSVLYSAIMMAFFYKNSLHSIDIPSVVNSASGIQLIRNFWLTKNVDNARTVWNLLSEYKQYTLIWEMAENSNNQMLSDLISIGMKEDSSEFFDIQDSLIKLHYSLELVDEEQEKEIVQCFIKHSNIIEEINKSEDLDVIEYSHELYLIVDMIENVEDIKTKINSKLVEVSKEEWIQAFNKHTYLLSLILSQKEKNPKSYLENSYFDGILDFSERWIKGKIEPTRWIIDNWLALIKILKKSFQTHFKSKITDILWRNLENINIQAFESNEEIFEIAKTINTKTNIMQDYLESSLQSKIDLNKLKLVDRILSHDKKDTFKPEDHFPDIIFSPINKLYQSATDNEEHKDMIIRIAQRFKVSLTENQELSEEDV